MVDLRSTDHHLKDLDDEISKLRTDLTRQDKRHTLLVERHDNLVRKTHRDDGMTMSGDLDLRDQPLPSPRFDDRLHITEERLDENLPALWHRINNLEKAAEQYDESTLDVDSLVQRIMVLEDGFNSLNEGKVDTERRISFIQSMFKRSNDTTNARIDNITNAFGETVKRINVEIEDSNDRVDNVVREVGDEIKDIHEGIHINSKAIGDILDATPMLEERSENFCTDNVDVDYVRVDGPYYERLAYNLSAGDRNSMLLILLALRNMREEDVATLMRYCKNIALHHLPELFIEE